MTIDGTGKLFDFYFLLLFYIIFYFSSFGFEMENCSSSISIKPVRWFFIIAAATGARWKGLKGKMEKHGVKCFIFSSFHISFLISFILLLCCPIDKF